MPRALATPAARAKLCLLGRLLPPVERAGFECRLGETLAALDMSLNLRRDQRSARAFREHGGRGPWWETLRRLLRAVEDSATPLHDALREMWLEFDLIDTGEADQLTIPCVFATFHKKEIAPIAALEQFLDLSLDGAAPAAISPALRGCLDHLPAGGFPLHLGAMLSRSGSGVRLALAGLATADIPDYLRRVGWPGSAERAGEVLTWLGPLVDRLCLNLDIGSRVLPGFKLEGYFLPARQREDEARRWRCLLDALVEAELCLPAKRDALLAWPGYNHQGQEGSPWPRNLAALARHLSPAVAPVFLRTLNHVKLSHEEDRPLTAKAYFGFHLHWLRLDEGDGDGNGA